MAGSQGDFLSNRLSSGGTVLHSRTQGRGVLLSPHPWTCQLAMPIGRPVGNVKPVQGEMGPESHRSEMKLKGPIPHDRAKQWVWLWVQRPEVGKRRRNQPRKVRRRSPGDLLSWEPRKERHFGRRENRPRQVLLVRKTGERTDHCTGPLEVSV